MRMDRRTAIVTGASLGIGRAISLAFARAGANVALVARRPEPLEQARSVIAAAAPSAKLATVAADIATAEGCRRAYDEATAALGPVDVVVNNAGASATGVFTTITDEAWQADLDLKLFAAIRLARLAMPGMAARRWGRIINILNTAAKAPAAGTAPTSVTRAAGLALTKVLAGEGAPDNVLVNALLVGRIESDQWVRASAKQGKPIDDFYAGMGAKIPLGRVGTADEFASMALFLASDAGSYVTGTAINVDGGLCPVA